MQEELKSSEHINEKSDGTVKPRFRLLSLFSDPVDLATWSQQELLKFVKPSRW